LSIGLVRDSLSAAIHGNPIRLTKIGRKTNELVKN
jgi:hypothetical protein